MVNISVSWSVFLVMSTMLAAFLFAIGGASPAYATSCSTSTYTYYQSPADYAPGGYTSWGVEGTVSAYNWNFYNGHLLDYLDMEVGGSPGVYWLQAGAGQGTVSGLTSSGRQVYFEYNLPGAGYWVWFGGTVPDGDQAAVDVYNQVYNPSTATYTWELQYHGSQSWYSTHPQTTSSVGLAVANTESENFPGYSGPCNGVYEDPQSSLQYAAGVGGNWNSWWNTASCQPVACNSPYVNVKLSDTYVYESGN